MRPISSLLLTCLFALGSVNTVFADEFPASLAPIIRFVEAHRLDVSDRDVSDPDHVLGSQQDQNAFFVAKGIAASHQSLKKDALGKGWRYLAEFADFPADRRNEAKAYAVNIWNTLRPEFEAQGFELHKGNSWDTFTMTKRTAGGVIQVWLDYTANAGGTHVTLMIAPNVGG